MGAKRSKRIASDPEAAKAAQGVVIAALGIDPKATTPKASWKVGCFYGDCDRTFNPHGSGAVIHSGCKSAAPVWSAFVATKDDAEARAAMVATATKLVADRK